MRKRYVEDIIILWLDDAHDHNVEVQAQPIDMLHQYVNDIYPFSDPDACVDFVTTLVNERAFIIVGDILDEQIIPLIHDITQCDSIYILCGNSTFGKNRLVKYRKVRSVFADMVCLCEQLQVNQRHAEKQLIQFHTMSLPSSLSTDVDKNENKNKQNAAFMMLLKLCQMRCDKPYFCDKKNGVFY